MEKMLTNFLHYFQNAARIVRALFEIAIQKSWAVMARRMLVLTKVVDKRIWEWEHPFRQCEGLKFEILNKLESKKLSVDRLREYESSEIGK